MRKWLCCLILLVVMVKFFLAQECFCIGIDILTGVKMWESEGFVNVGSISRFCECDLL